MIQSHGKPMTPVSRKNITQRVTTPKETTKVWRSERKIRRGQERRGEHSQQVPDKGWEGIRTNTRAGENKVNGKTQIKGSKHSNVIDSNHGTRDKETGVPHYASGRIYKQGIQKDLGPAQTTLNSFWKGKEKDVMIFPFFYFFITFHSTRTVFVRGRRTSKTLRLIGFDSAEEQLMPNGSRA